MSYWRGEQSSFLFSIVYVQLLAFCHVMYHEVYNCYVIEYPLWNFFEDWLVPVMPKEDVSSVSALVLSFTRFMIGG